MGFLPFGKPLKKWQPKEWFLPATIYKGVFESPEPPKYEPSELELETQQYLKDILEGKSPLFQEGDVERRYQTFKDKMLPEYQRLSKEAKIRHARSGIRGGPEELFAQRSGEDQLQRLMDARRRIEDETQRLEQMRKSDALGQLTGMGRTRSAQEYQSDMAAFQQKLQEQQEMANMLASVAMMAFGVPPIPTAMDYYQQLYGGQQQPYYEPLGVTSKQTLHGGYPYYGNR